MKFNPFESKHFEKADDLWEALSPTREHELAKAPSKLVYRGHADAATWKLIPSVLREEFIERWTHGQLTSDRQILREINLLECFADFCDQIGVRLPNDSPSFRKEHLSVQYFNQEYYKTKLWPDPKLLEVMALAQHHGVPTRLLDWTKIPYVAAYFAASGALGRCSNWKPDDKLAIWVLNLERINLYEKVKICVVSGAVSPHLAAQAGLFTVHPHDGVRGESLEVKGLEEEFLTSPETPLLCLTLPSTQSIRLMELCNKAGFTGASIYPSADGAGKAVIDNMNLWSAKEKLTNNNLNRS